MELEFRKASEVDVNNIMKIIEQAQESMKNNCIDQWQNNYPNVEIIKKDIIDNNGYVLSINNNIIGTVVVSFNSEKTYENIFDGKWICNNKYAVIHRLAVNNEYKGLGIASLFLEKIETLCLNNMISSIRIDTHKDNNPMQQFLKKNNFEYCGVILLQDNAERIAFEKLIQ